MTDKISYDFKNESFGGYISAVIYTKSNEIFIGQFRRVGSNNKENRSFPGGGVDQGESLKEYLYREIYEETGIKQSSLLLKTVVETYVSKSLLLKRKKWIQKVKGRNFNITTSI